MPKITTDALETYAATLGAGPGQARDFARRMDGAAAVASLRAARRNALARHEADYQQVLARIGKAPASGATAAGELPGASASTADLSRGRDEAAPGSSATPPPILDGRRFIAGMKADQLRRDAAGAPRSDTEDLYAEYVRRFEQRPPRRPGW